MWWRIGRGIAGLIVEAGGAETTDYAVGHGLATRDGVFILEIEEDIGFGGSMKGFGVPGWDGAVS